MSSTSQITDFNDLMTDLQNRVRVTTGVSATETQAKRYINISLQDVHVGTDYVFPWTERRAFITTHAPYSTGTLSVSAGSTALTGSGTLWNTANTYGQNNLRVGAKITIAGGTDIYRIATVTSDTAATLETKYVAAANASGAAYVSFDDEYALASDFARPIDFQMFSPEWNVPIVNRQELRRTIHWSNQSGRPRVAAILDLARSGTTAAVRKVRLYPYPDQTYVIPYGYVSANLAVTALGVEQISLSATTDEPLMPLRYRHVIVLHALENWYRDKKDDARSQEVKAEYVDLMQRMTFDYDIGTHNRVKIEPHAGMYRGAAVRPYTKRGGPRYSINNRFDQFRD